MTISCIIMYRVRTTKHCVLLLILALTALIFIPKILHSLTPQGISLWLLPVWTQTAGSCSSSSPVTHFIMTKIEKTGSTTLLSIFARFVLTKKVNTVIGGQDKGHIDWTQPKGEGWFIGPRPGLLADVLITHAKYNETMLDELFVKDFKLIVPVRDPESWLNSAVTFFKKHNNISMSAEELIMNKSAFYKPRDQKNVAKLGSWYHLTQLQWLGFDYKQRNNFTAIKKYIDYIVPKIDIPILLEQFDASLVILRKRFCWDYTDIFYMRSVVGKTFKIKPLSAEARQILYSPEANLGEKLLYDRINESWWNQPEITEDGFWDEVEHFQQLNIKVSTVWCPQVMRSENAHIVAQSHWHGSISISAELCRYVADEHIRGNLHRYARNEPPFIRKHLN